MALVVTGTPQAAASTSVTLPAHQVGDIIVVFAYRDGSATTPTVPTAGGTVPTWSDIENAAGASSNSGRASYAVATATNHTSGTWTNATGMAAIVLRGQHASPIGGHATGVNSSANKVNGVALTQSVADGTSALLYFYGHRNVTAWDAAPAGYTRQASVASEVALNTKDSTTTDGAQDQTCTAVAGGCTAITVEILADVTVTGRPDRMMLVGVS